MGYVIFKNKYGHTYHKGFLLTTTKDGYIFFNYTCCVDILNKYGYKYARFLKSPDNNHFAIGLLRDKQERSDYKITFGNKNNTIAFISGRAFFRDINFDYHDTKKQYLISWDKQEELIEVDLTKRYISEKKNYESS